MIVSIVFAHEAFGCYIGKMSEEKIRFVTSQKTKTGPPKRPGADREVIQTVETAISDALLASASEIHFNPGEEGLKVFVRGESGLKEVLTVEPELSSSVLNRIKVLASMDITRTHIPQNGYFTAIMADESRVDLMVFTFPTLYGEKAVVRSQVKKKVQTTLDQLAMAPKTLAQFRAGLQRESGLFLFVGPPGSGRRTTVYAAITEVAKPGHLVMGWDQVIKYEIPGMVQGKPDERITFSNGVAISGLMGQNPDVAYIGGILEPEEAKAVIQGAFAKRRVFARMTANDTMSALQNLVDMGLQPFLIMAAFKGCLAQRLIRRLCKECREPYTPDANMQTELGVRLPQGTSFYRAEGCPACH